MKRRAGAVERFVCCTAGRLEVSKCRAVLGTAFAGDRAGRDGRVGEWRAVEAASVGLRARQAAQTERSGEQRLWWMKMV